MVRPTEANPITQYIAEPSAFQRGGTGSLYVARHRPTTDLVAIKVIDLHIPKLKYTYENEVRILQRMKQSKFTVPLREAFEFHGRGYIVMDIFHQDLFTRSERLESISEIIYIFHQICQGVAELHENNIAHLDLKPENILLDQHDHVKICDMGGSLLWKKTPNYHALVGSDFYLAPELLSHKTGYDATKADVWSLGILLYVLLTGTFPFEGDSQEEAMSNYFASRLSFNEFDSLYPRDTECRHLLTRLLTRNPSTRPSVSEILNHSWFQRVKSS